LGRRLVLTNFGFWLHKGAAIDRNLIGSAKSIGGAAQLAILSVSSTMPCVVTMDAVSALI
jgi:hypothetical protein